MNLGVLVYQNQTAPYHSSINVGDYIQSLAALNVYRKVVESRLNKQYTMSDFLDLVLNNKIDGFNFIFIKRDNIHEESQYKGLENVITIMNGWWMRPFNRKNDLSFEVPKNLKPIFTSFHIYENNLLSEKYINTFREFAPIGCRDVDTVNKLKDKNIDAYFSGCLTTTIDFYKWSNKGSDETLYVDYPKEKLEKNEIEIQHNIPEFKEDFRKFFKIALNLLKRYSLSRKIYTSRLHCYLPCLGMEVPVEFNHSKNSKLDTWGEGHERFRGLKELNSDKDSLKTIQKNLNSLKNTILNIG